MNITLTADERETCAKFEALLKRLVVGPVLSLGATYISQDAEGGFPSISSTDRNKAYYAPYSLDIASQIEVALGKLYGAESTSEEVRRAKRIAELKADLERLEGEQVAA